MGKGPEDLGRAQLFLDTTYLLPFFQVPITVEGFEISNFKTFIGRLAKVHVAELSVYEVKAKLVRLSRHGRRYEEPQRAFGRNLDTLRLDEKFIFHPYEKQEDERFNQLMRLTKRPDLFDLIILSQAFAVGRFLTEDEDLLELRDSNEFSESPLSKMIRIRRWKEIATRKLD